MYTQNKLTDHFSRLMLVLFFSLIFSLAACNPTTDNSEPGPGTNEEMKHMDNMDHDNAEGEHIQPERIPNEGAVIHILSPAEGSTFAADEDIVVEVEVEGFTLGEDGSHWHIYIDGASWGMVMGQATSQVLRGVDPGDHKLAVHLAGGDHIELEDGDVISITVAE